MTDTTLFKGETIELSGQLPNVGENAPDFRFVNDKMQNIRFSEVEAKARIILCMPSLDTGTCSLETRTFNKLLADLPQAKAIVITKDLPFAMKRFCKVEGVENIISASDFRFGEFSSNYNADMTSGALAGLHARVCFVVNSEGEIVFREIVGDVVNEPNYEPIMEAVNALLSN